MSQIEKLLIPLIDENISFDDINADDFVGVYTEDINSPGLDYIYLVFVYDISNLRPKLATNAIDYVRRIGNELYHIYKFPRITTDIQKILSGTYTSISNKGISRVYTFWNGFDNITANYPFYRTLANESYYRAIPEETYIPLCKRKEPQGFTVAKQ
jgi:hypothetical protein